MTVTIPKDLIIPDPYYRYRRPEAEMVYSQRKNKTTVTNLESICKSIDRPPSILRKFLQKKLARPIRGGDTFAGKCEVLDDYIEEFILFFVICGRCGNPETLPDGHCMACGSKN